MTAFAATMSRPSEDRVVLGVCAAIARRIDVDPTIVRVIAAIGLVVLTTPFLVAYAALALVVPREDGRMLIGGEPADRRESVIGWIIVIVAAGLLISTPSLFGLGGDADVFEIGMLLVAASLVGLALSRSGSPDSADVPAAPSTAVTSATATEQMPGSAGPGTAETTEVPTAPLVPAPGSTGRTTKPPKEPKAPKEPSIFGPVFAAIIGLIGFGAVTVAVFDIALTATAVAVIAGGLAVACGGAAIALYGRRGTFPLIALGSILALVAVAAAVGRDEFDRGIGYREALPATAAEVENGYEIGAGFIQVDLRDAQLPAGETVMPLHVGYGAAEVIVPRDLEVVSTGETITGELAADDGVAANPATPRDGDTKGAGDRQGKGGNAAVPPEPPVLVIDGDVDVGAIELSRPGERG